jgi:hypothetical protein
LKFTRDQKNNRINPFIVRGRSKTKPVACKAMQFIVVEQQLSLVIGLVLKKKKKIFLILLARVFSISTRK